MMKRTIQRIMAAFLAIMLLFSFPISASAKKVAAPITLCTYSDADEQSRKTKFIIYADELYISGRDAKVLSGYDTYDDNDGQPKFRCGYHFVEYDGHYIDFAGTNYYPLQGLMNALSTSYYYEESADSISFSTCKSYFENLLMDCESIYRDGYELNFLEGTGWQVAGVYEIIAGLRVDMLWGGYQRELYEDTLRGIIATEDAELTATLKQGNSIMKKFSTLLKFAKKDINGLETYVELLGPDFDGVIEAYSILNELIPGVKVEDMIELIDYFMSAAKLGEIYPNAIRYGLVENPFIRDPQINMAADRIYSLHDKNRVSADVVLTDFMNAVIIGGTEKLGEEVLKKSFEDFSLLLIDDILGLDYGKFIINSSYIKLAKLAFDELGMKERSTAVMQTVAARNIQFAACLQYELSSGQYEYITYDNIFKNAPEKPDPMRTKYSTILYLRACQYAYSLYEFDPNLSSLSAYWNEKTTEAINKLLAYSDEELTRTVNNEKLTFRLSDYIQSETTDTSEEYGELFTFDLNAENGYEDHISFKPDKSGWYTFTADGTGYFWMEAPNREMTEYRLEGHIFSEYGLHYYLSGDQQYYIKLCANSEANGELFVEESQFPSLTEGETLQLPLADCYGGFDGGGYAINYFSFTPSSSGIYYFSCGPKDIFTRSATWGIARDAFGNGIKIISTTEDNAGITTMEYQLISGNTYYFGLSASPGGICNITVSSTPNESGNKTDNLLLSDLPDEFMYTSGAGAWMTVINLKKDGSFTGGYHDTNAGETGDEYPNGTTYICNFSGELDDFEKVDEYTYTTSLLKITTEQNSGEVYYENGVRYIATDPYGFTNADVLYLYLPGTPCADMPQDCLDWLWYHNLSDTLPSNMYVLYNINGGEVFFGNIDMTTNVDGRNYKVLESDISGTIMDITGKLNIRSGPGTSYEVVGYLLPNNTIEVYETAYNEDITWGHIEQGWISMDYVGNITHRNSANTIYAEDYVDYTTAEILAELGPEYDIPGAYAGSYLLKTINYPNLYFAYNLDDPTSEPYITGFEPVVCIYLFGDALINKYLSADMSKAEIDEAVKNPDVLSSSTDTVYVALDNTGNVFQYIIETQKAYISYEWYLDSGSSTNNPADSICVSPK